MPAKITGDNMTVALTQDARPDADKLFTDKAPLGPVTAWSYSALKVFEECPYRTFLSRVKRIPEPSSPAADRGSQIHQEAEDYVNGTLGEFPESLKKFKAEFEELRELFAEAKVELEGEWAFTEEWQPCGWVENRTWVRIKLDALVHESDTSARVIDYKTGKKFGNEIGHSQQALLYAIASFIRYSNLEYVQTELWYLDHAETTKQSYTRAEAMAFFPGFHARATRMTSEFNFEPNPSKSACRWCSYRQGDDPACQWGVE